MLIEMLNERPNQTASGIVLPGNEKPGMPTMGKVIKTGPESSFKESQVVLFRRYSVDEVKYSTAQGTDEKIFFITDDEVIATINA